ncbi:TPA: hypothetical protein I8271_004981 [Kluyvera intermedia]|uniref:Uncharacterized protein n=2 Tax=Enterobacteriaceae TaxID=543 RepID=A0AAC8QPX0_9ENTR|nr:hypothetical protein [Phytobacter ursingii]HAT2207358.1 hypothetical protein [Kluyvera intermedia]AKL12312.1 hypothetical protein AB182_13800 [Phytobacter ursingii]HAT2518053.1 hypothetical protein [Kluyvera intermedia]HAT2606206.1 hypothetical protein [Kluyvera intermedia]HAT2682994.1 hypothetical protein [Kluyvera intermedia]
MSRHEQARYQIERQRRQELFNQRVSETTRVYLDRYRNILNDVQNQGISKYVQAEFSALQRELETLKWLVDSDPATARDRSIALGQQVHALPRHARAMRQAVVEAERAAEHVAQEEVREAVRQRAEQETKAREEVETVWQNELTNWDDPLARQLAFKALAELRRHLLDSNHHTTVEQLRAELGNIKHEYEQRSQERRTQEYQTAVASTTEDSLQLCREQIAAASRQAPEHAAAFAATLDTASSLSPEELSRRMVEVTSELDTVVVDESCRREVVQAVYRSLEDAGFVMEKPRLVNKDDSNEVVIRAMRPAGAKAEFKIELSGKLNYKFDHYQGSACKKDIDTVLPRLQSIYGIQLSTERVVWENPDDKDSDARPQPGMTREK